MSEKKLSLIIPCYNEGAGIPQLIETLNRLQGLCAELQIVVVDNGSTDATAALLDRLLPVTIQRVNVKENQGYGYGILMGLRAATTPYLGWTHADLQTDPEDIVRAWQLMTGDVTVPTFVKGKRHGRPLFDVFFTVGMSFFETCLLKMPLWDINAQPTLFHRDFFELWRDPPHDFSLDLYAYAMARKHGYAILRFPVWFRQRPFGQSSWNNGLRSKWRFIKRTVAFSYRLRRGWYARK